MARHEVQKFWKNAAISAAVAVGGGAMTDKAFAQTAQVEAGQPIPFNHFGDASFADSVAQAVDDEHLAQIYAGALQEGTLSTGDHDAFYSSGRSVHDEAVRGLTGTTEALRPGAQTPWMTYSRGRIAGAGPEQLQYTGTEDAIVRTFQVETDDGRVVTFGIVVEVPPNGGRPCYNVIVLRETPRLTAAAPRVEAPCPPRINVPVEHLPENSLVTVMYVYEIGEREIPTIHNSTCPTASLPETCPGCTALVADRATQELETRYHRQYGILSAGTTRVVGREIHIDIPPVIRVELDDGTVVNIDTNRALENETMMLYLSCPRTERENHGSLLRRSRDEVGHGNSATLRASDWRQARENPDNSKTLALEWTEEHGEEVYRLNRD